MKKCVALVSGGMDSMCYLAQQIGRYEILPLVFNYGQMKRDFTYIDDIVEGVAACLEHRFQYEIINLGNNTPVELLYLIELIEKSMGKEADKLMLPMQPGDCEATYADIARAGRLLGFEPSTKIEQGLKLFIDWYKDYFKL